MDCAALRDLLHPYLDGELEVVQNVAVLKHMEMCASCHARCEEERRLSEIVAHAALSPLVEADRRRLLDRAYALHDRPRWRSRLAIAAGLLLAAGLGVLATADPFCWGGCPTGRVIEQAHRTAQTAPPRSLSELRASFPEMPPLPPACQVKVLGGNMVRVPGAPDRPMIRLRCAKSGKAFSFVWIPDGHAHFWQRTERKQGRDYVVGSSGPMRLVGWRDQRGLWACLGETETSRLFAFATAVRGDG